MLDLPKLNFNENGELEITATPASSKHDFDFLKASGIFIIKN